MLTSYTSKQNLWKIPLIAIVDTCLIFLTTGVALLVRFDFSMSKIPREYMEAFLPVVGIMCLATIVVFWFRRMYHYIWRSVNATDVLSMTLSSILAFCAGAVICVLLQLRMPLSVWFLMFVFQFCALVGSRCALRMITVVRGTLLKMSEEEGHRIMLIGAGVAGQMLAQEITTSQYVDGNLCCIIDDNPAKQGKFLHGVPIVGGRNDILKAVERYRITQIIFAIPSAPAKTKTEILELCKKTSCRVRVLPGLYQLVNGQVSLSQVQDVAIEDLLGRTPVELDTEAISKFLTGKVVLVTGGGGSIGSELCRQIARHNPRKLIILDIYENNAYDIQQELLRKYGNALNLRVEIASVREKERIYQLFDYYRPQVVFHAAAHKHVPLMEECPTEAVKNNIFGTYHVVRAAEKYCTEKFVMISSDKAVNPTNFMGATKRFCEMILQSRQNSKTQFCAVRFGNVLGSNGSVVPLFQKQIQEGGPVTITDRRIIRYFMTISEAAALVMEAGAIAKPGQIMVLDMGEPVRILTLAENLIRLSGLEPYRDIEIKEIGLRPGEKLYEELLMKSEHLQKTDNAKIFIEEQRSISRTKIMEALEALSDAIEDTRSKEQLIRFMQRLVPTYCDPDEVNRRAVEQSLGHRVTVNTCALKEQEARLWEEKPTLDADELQQEQTPVS